MIPKNKPRFSCGQVVFHLASQGKQPGVVIGVVETFGNFAYLVDWGQTEGITEASEVCLNIKYTPDYGES